VNFEDFIKKLESDNPTLFAAQSIKVTIISFRTQLKRAYNEGFEQGKQFKKDLDSFNKKSEFGDIFGDIFKKK